jgi:DNA-binding YbaB/EbfC family protein
MSKLDEELAKEEIETSSGGGAVTVRMNGRQELLALAIREDVFQEGDRQMLEELIVAAVNEAHRKSGDLARERVAAITGGLNIPGLL